MIRAQLDELGILFSSWRGAVKMGLLRGAWSYRHFILSSIRADFRSRFARSSLGGLWMIIHPLAQVLIFSFVFSEVMMARMPGVNNRYAYAIYLMSGTLAWSLFSDIIQRCLTVFIENGNLLQKMVFPRICLPLIVVGNAIVTNLLLLVAIIGVFVLLGHLPGPVVLFLPLLMLQVVALAVGAGLCLGILNVFIRDIGQVVPILLQLGFWFTPIVYMPEIVPQQYRHLLAFNPLYSLVTSYQGALVFNRQPAWESLAPIAVLSALLLALALYLFRRASAEMVDVL